MRKKNTLLAIAILFVFTSQITKAQNAQDNQNALNLVKKNAAAIGLSNDNIINSRVSDTYTDAVSGATLVYLQQTYKGVDVDRTLQVLAFKNGSLISAAGERLAIKSPGSRPALQKTPVPAVSVDAAIQAAAQYLHLGPPVITQRPAAGTDFSKPTDFGDLGIAKDNVTGRLLWIPQHTLEGVKLVWEVNISPKKSPDSWRVIVDATSGKAIKKDNYNVPDNWKKISPDGEAQNDNTYNDLSTLNNNNNNNDKKLPPQPITSVTYRVVPFPVQAPSFPNGSPSLVTDPWELSPASSGATPFIWNDDGSRQYKYTRGNNVLAQEDLNGDNGDGKRAIGTVYKDNLYFDFQPRFNKPPTDSINQGLAMTNLFYWNNIMHDLSYQYGFNEVSGNFQQNNLGRGGQGYDYVFADAQDGSGLDNANFGTPPDGQHPRMQMFLWNSNPNKGFKINSPESIAGRVTSVEGQVSPNNLLANVGPVTGDLVLYKDAGGDTLQNGCVTAGNKKALAGNIALINRGSCFFVDKIKNAQRAGATAVVMVDNVPGEFPIIMGGDDSSIIIPAVMISYEDGQKIKDVLNGGTPVNITLSPSPMLDGDLDNSIICHEYTHGISNRLTGGPANVSCLFNAEQMGEGWSDYISLMTITDWSKAKKSDGPLPRGLGTYVLGESPNGPGIRQYPYSTDMSIDPHTYADIPATGGEPHAIGEIWTSILWDMTWFIIQDEGINKDIFNAQGAGGNSVAYQLVIEGLKLQPCSPGFVDGRDAILRADSLLYGGRHSCAIWRAFARRGVGVGASEGSSNVVGDEIVDFKQGAIYITKRGPKTISPGKEFDYTIGLKAKAVCTGNVSPNYSVTDSLPSNVTYVSSDGKYDPATRTVSFKNIDMNDGDSLTYKITVKVNANTSFPDSVYLNDPVTSPQISNKWVAKNGDSLAWTTLNLGIYFIYSNDASVKDQESLVTKQSYIIPGVKTTFSFWNEVANNDFLNGGVVEITSDSGKTWQDLGPYMDPSGFTYTEPILGNSVLNGRYAFSGFGFGPTSIDLSSFAGKNVKLRFRYATSDGSASTPDGGTGWIIDDILLSASPMITNTARLYDNTKALKGFSTVITKIQGKNLQNDFVVVKDNETKALLNWHYPGEMNGTYQVERSTDNGTSYRTIGTVNTLGDNATLQSYNFADASPAEGLNVYRIHHINSNGTVDYSDAKSVIFDRSKAIQVYPNPAKDRIRVDIPGNNKAVILQLTDGAGNQIKSYKASGQSINLNLPALASGTYYLNVIKTDGTSKHKIVIE
jgi:hypothetical protein